MANQFGVDRARFLAFAAAIAGAASFQACSTSSDKQSVDNGGAAGLSSAGRGPQAGAPNAGASDSAGGSTGDLAGGAAGAISEPDDAGAAGASECSDSAAVADCSELTAWCMPYCHAAVMNLKPAVAVAAEACLKLDATGNCDTGYACLAAATAKGCPEDVGFICGVATGACSHPRGATEPSCVQLLSGMNASGRSQTEGCITQGCYSVYSCAEGLFFQ
jgi:hypothetical protein